MRVISKMSDYYDSVQAYGQDKNKVFLRKEKEVNFDNFWKPLTEKVFLNRWYLNGWENHDWVEPIVIGFCGKIYTLFEYHMRDREEIYYPIGKRHFLYSLDDLKSFLIKTKQKKRIIDLFSENKTKHNKRIRWRYDSKTTIEKMTEFFGFAGSTDFEWIFTKLDVPIFKVKRHRIDYYKTDYPITLNCNLKELDFQRVFDPYMAYQELEMFISNVLKLNEPEMVPIEDKYRIASHGFDEKSFRNTEHRSKPRRKKKHRGLV